MGNACEVFVAGNPAPQGSKRHVGGGVLLESCKRVKPWREDIRAALLHRDDGRPVNRFIGPVNCDLEFVLPRIKSAPKRSTPPADRKPDLDKLCRAVFDAITSAGVIEDDARIVRLASGKRMAEIGETPGVHIFIEGAK